MNPTADTTASTPTRPDADSHTQRATGRFPWRFVLLTFGISWFCWLAVALTGQNGFENLEIGTVLVLGGFGPGIAGLWLTWRDGGTAALVDFWQRLTQTGRIRLFWWLPIACLLPGLIVVGALLTGSSLDASPLQGILQNPGLIIAVPIFVLIFGPFSEELGWRGYALDWLQNRYHALVASLILGVIWWVWHLPLVALPGTFLGNVGPDPFFLFGYLLIVTSFSVLFTWVYNHTSRSILAMILMHFSVNLFTRLVALPIEAFVAWSIVQTLFAAFIVWRYGPRALRRQA